MRLAARAIDLVCCKCSSNSAFPGPMAMSGPHRMRKRGQISVRVLFCTITEGRGHGAPFIGGAVPSMASEPINQPARERGKRERQHPRKQNPPDDANVGLARNQSNAEE